jgi:hypothetical protein
LKVNKNKFNKWQEIKAPTNLPTGRQAFVGRGWIKNNYEFISSELIF